MFKWLKYILIAQKTYIFKIPINIYPKNIGLYSKEKLGQRKRFNIIWTQFFIDFLKREGGRRERKYIFWSCMANNRQRNCDFT